MGIVTGEADTGDDVGAVETIGVITGEAVDNLLARGKDETVATGILTNGTEAGHVVGRAEPDQVIVEAIDVSIIVDKLVHGLQGWMDGMLLPNYSVMRLGSNLCFQERWN